jgi:ABC-type dipeptide/oligopeptide/nickel transport system permease subunit
VNFSVIQRPARAHAHRAWTDPFVATALLILIITILAGALPDLLAPLDPIRIQTDAILQPPGGRYVLGTDELGRDLLSRIIFGARASLAVAAVAVVVALGIGMPLGLLSGYYVNSPFDVIVGRIVDALLAFPVFVIALAITAVMGAGLWSAIAGIGIANIPTFARVARGQTLNEAGSEYVLAARAVGAGGFRLITRHITPNILAPLIVQSSLTTAVAVLTEASLSYLGLGIQPPQASWGAMLRAGVGYLESAPWVALMPGLAIFLLTVAFNVLGDRLQIRLDPRLRR